MNCISSGFNFVDCKLKQDTLLARWLKITIGVTLSLAVILAVTVVISFFTLKSYLPEYSGEIKTSEVSGNIEVYRDTLGIPYIFAEGDTDAAFALGYLHAQERFFQMEMIRRAGEGRLSEVFGSSTIPYDKMFRTLGIAGLAEESLNNASSSSKKILSAYSNGVNTFLKKSEGKTSLEFTLLGYEPEMWTPRHSIIAAKMLAWELNIAWWGDFSYARLIEKFDSAKVKEILPVEDYSPTIIPAKSGKSALLYPDIINIDKDFRKFIGFDGTHIGSNNWTVNGEKSVSGFPVIANDPHLSLGSPSRWYIASIKSPEWNAEGFTIPGMPAVVIGKNKNIAWTVTNVMADDTDFYFEKLDEGNIQYLLDGEWKNLSRSEEIIKVKDSLDVIFKIRKTHRGPLISDIHTYNIMFDDSADAGNDSIALSMRWTAFDPSDELSAILKINKAANWDDFKSAVEEFKVPGQNFVYADIAGNIGYICGAKIPIRKFVSPFSVYDGSTSASDWTGFVPYEQMPKILNPGNNFIATANNKVTENFKFYISNLWEPPSRIERINELIESKDKHSAEDFIDYQMDFKSRYAPAVTQKLLSSFNHVKVKSKNLKTALELLNKWDYNFNALEQSPAIYSVFYNNLLKNIFLDEMGETLYNEYVFLANVPFKAVTKILSDSSSTWVDDVNTEKMETIDDILRKSLADAVLYFEENIGDDPALWQWGKLHQLTFEHNFSGQSSLLDKVINIGPFKLGGNGTTIFNTEYSFTDPYKVALGPSMRFVYDLSGTEFSAVLPTGQSGHVLSGHYKDMTELWLSGKMIKINADEEKVKGAGFPLLTFTPN